MGPSAKYTLHGHCQHLHNLPSRMCSQLCVILAREHDPYLLGRVPQAWHEPLPAQDWPAGQHCSLCCFGSMGQTLDLRGVTNQAVPRCSSRPTEANLLQACLILNDSSLSQTLQYSSSDQTLCISNLLLIMSEHHWSVTLSSQSQGARYTIEFSGQCCVRLEFNLWRCRPAEAVNKYSSCHQIIHTVWRHICAADCNPVLNWLADFCHVNTHRCSLACDQHDNMTFLWSWYSAVI